MNLRKYLPYEDYALTSKLSVEEVRKRIFENIEPKKTYRFPGFNKNTVKLYEGTLIDNAFTITRIINSRNSFLPVITGDISTFLGKTQIKIEMRLVHLVLVFMSLWLGIVGLVCIGIFLVGALKFKEILETGFSPMLLIPYAMFIFGCLLVILSFKAESKKSKDFLLELLEGQEENS